MRKTKIICTIGPSSSDEKSLNELVKAGMDIARLNFSHGTHKEHSSRIRNIHKLEQKTGICIPILGDLSGPKIRVGILKKEVVLQDNTDVVLSCKKTEKNLSYIPVSYKNLWKNVSRNDDILIDDGNIKLKVLYVKEQRVFCKVIDGGLLKSKKSLNIPGSELDIKIPTEKDKNDLIFAYKSGVDFIGISFVRSVDDIKNVRDFLKRQGSRFIPLIAKIETPFAVKNINQIIDESDGIMIARGDLGIEMPTEEIPLIQKDIIKRCLSRAKPVIIATQMMESMINNVLPTRAEASDVANAVFDGSDILMLSGETSLGKYPALVAATMDRIVLKTEGYLDYNNYGKTLFSEKIGSIAQAISHSVSSSAESVGAKAIVIPTFSGSTARLVSSLRPKTPIFAVTHNKMLLPYLCLLWGVEPLYIPEAKTTDEMIRYSISAVKKVKKLKKGDIIVITAGIPLNKPGMTNLIKIHQL